MQPRDRIKELRRMKASELIPNEKNWRRHPNTQKLALSGILEEIGYADALLAREREDGELVLVDGHLRRSVSPDAEVPVLVLDITEEEEDLLLTTLDPLASMAETDNERLEALLDSIDVDNDRISVLLESIRDGVGVNQAGFDNYSNLSIPTPSPEFEPFSELATSNRCPKCSYEW